MLLFGQLFVQGKEGQQ